MRIETRADAIALVLAACSCFATWAYAIARIVVRTVQGQPPWRMPQSTYLQEMLKERVLLVMVVISFALVAVAVMTLLL